MRWVGLLGVLALACGDDASPDVGANDAGTDVGSDAGVDAPDEDAARDAGPDATDVGIDAPNDAGQDVPMRPDAGPCMVRPAAARLMDPVEHNVPVRGAVSGVYDLSIRGDIATARDVVVVGMPLIVSDPTLHSALLIFRFDGVNFVFEAEIRETADTEVPSRVGRFVEISPSASTIITGTTVEALVTRREADSWTTPVRLQPTFADGETPLLASVAATDERIALGYYRGGEGIGGVHVYRLETDTWVLEESFFDDRFNGSNGNAISLTDDRLVVGNRNGIVVVYERDDTGWSESDEIRGREPSHHGGDMLAIENGAIRLHQRTESGLYASCESVSCNVQCDFAYHEDWIAHGGAPAHAGSDRFGMLLRFDGTEWVSEHETTFEARSADVSSHFAVFTDEGFGDDPPIRAIQIAPWPPE